MGDIVGGLVFVLLSSVVYRWSLDLPTSRTSVPGPELFPQLVAALGIVLGVALIVRALRAHVRGGRPAGTAPPTESFDWKGAILAVGSLVALSATFLLAMERIGFPVSAFAFLVSVLLVLGERKVPMLVLLPLALAGGVYYLFGVLLGVRLPLGFLS